MYKFIVLQIFILVGSVVSTPVLKANQDVRIVGGEDVDITEVPYQVSVLYNSWHVCGGSIIAHDLILTAAHCVDSGFPDGYSVRVGSSSSKEGGEIIKAGDIVWHDEYNSNKMDNDIALIWLKRPLQFSESVAPIKMVEAGEEIADGEITTITGWGMLEENGYSSSNLQIVLIPKVNSKVCNAAYAPHYTITSTMMCAGLPDGGKDACQGDSGGPLVHDGKLAGVVSWGMGCARPNFPGVYAKVSALRDWVDENIMFLKMKHLLRNAH